MACADRPRCRVEKYQVSENAAESYDKNNRVCWRPLRTCKYTRRVLKPLYNRPSGIQAPELETQIELVFPDFDVDLLTFILPRVSYSCVPVQLRMKAASGSHPIPTRISFRAPGVSQVNNLRYGS